MERTKITIAIPAGVPPEKRNDVRAEALAALAQRFRENPPDMDFAWFTLDTSYGPISLRVEQ